MAEKKQPLDPRTQLILIVSVSGMLIQCSMKGWNAVLNLILICVPLIFLIQAERIRKAVSYAVLFLVSWFIAVFVIPHVSAATAILLSALTALFIKIMPGIVLGFQIMTTIEPADLIAALRKIHLPGSLVWTISIVFRFFPAVKEELGQTLQGMKTRGVRLSSFFQHPVEMMEIVSVPLIVSVVNLSEELLMATLTKGFSVHNERTSLSDPKMGKRDWTVILLIMGAWILHFSLN